MSVIEGQSVKMFRMRVTRSPKYRKSRMRLLALIFVAVLTILALFFTRPGEDTHESRTADWASVNFTDFGLIISYPAELNLSTNDVELFKLQNEDQRIIMKTHLNSANENAEQWLDRIHGLGENLPLEIGDVQAKSRQQNDQFIIVFVHQSRIFELLMRTDEVLQRDFVEEIRLNLVRDTSGSTEKNRVLELSDVAFKALFDSLKLAGTDQIEQSPAITGDQGADAHIQQLAENRGYRLQSVVAVDLGSADGFALNEMAAKAWRSLQTAAANAGVGLSVSSGYRSVDSQRDIFLGRLAVACAEQLGSNCSSEQVTSGQADEAIDEVLKTSSIPGYSRHHSGYTVDIGTDGQGAFEDFEGTDGWKWISKDNYKNAKRFGFIPSYPPNAGPQGPDPEPWEYVYVGPEYFLIGE